MDDIKLSQLSVNDGYDVYEMLQRIGQNENEFKNTAFGLSYEGYISWLVQQDQWSRGINLPDGYVKQTIYWLFVNNIPVGIGKIRHELNDASRKIGGNIGYAIDSRHRGKGYGTKLLRMLIKKAYQLNVDEILLTVEKYNPSSKAVIQKCGGYLIGENEDRWFFTF